VVAEFYDSMWDEAAMEDMNRMMELHAEYTPLFDSNHKQTNIILGPRWFDPHQSQRLDNCAIRFERWWKTLRNVTSRKFAISQNENLMGLVPGDTKPGDFMCVIMGAQVPFILRPLDIQDDAKSSKRYEFVGECYIHGIMNGEVNMNQRDMEWICLQ